MNNSNIEKFGEEWYSDPNNYSKDKENRPIWGDTIVPTGTLNILLEAVRDMTAELKETSRHYECDDCWYSCPMSDEGCCDDSAGGDCNCGAQRGIDLLGKYEAKFGELLK